MDELGDPVDEGLGAHAARRLLGEEPDPDQHRQQVGDESLVRRGLGQPEGAQERQTGPVGDATRSARLGLVSAGGRLVRREHRGPGLVELDELAQPVGEVRQPLGVGRHRTERVRLADHRLRELGGERPEDVVLAGEVLVEGGARAARAFGDQLHSGFGVAVLGEHLERGAEDATLGVGAPLTDQRVAAERGAASDTGVHRANATHGVQARS